MKHIVRSTLPLFVAVAVVVSAAAPASAGRLIGFPDPTPSPVDCSTQEEIARAAGDIISAYVIDNRLFVMMAERVEEVLGRDFSAALRMIALRPTEEVVAAALLEVHDGERVQSALDPETGQPVANSVDVQTDEDMVLFEFGDPTALDSVDRFVLEAFHTPTEGEPISCDQMDASSADLIEAGQVVQTSLEEPGEPADEPTEPDDEEPEPAEEEPGETAENESTEVDTTSSDEDRPVWPIVLIVFGVVVVGGGGWMVRTGRTRERGGGGSVPPPEQGGGPTYGSVPPEHDAFCDWELVAVVGPGPNGRQVKLRTAKGHPCCTYHVRVRTEVSRSDRAARGRQQPLEDGGAADGRRRMVDAHVEPVGIDTRGWAAARTGPASDLAWMQGLGDVDRVADRVAPEADFWQDHPFEEEPDAAASVRHDEATDVDIWLRGDCPALTPPHEGGGVAGPAGEGQDGGRSDYRFEWDAGVLVFPMFECTNSQPGDECPVEFGGQAHLRSVGTRDTSYVIDDRVRSDPDELEGRDGWDDLHGHGDQKDRQGQPTSVWTAPPWFGVDFKRSDDFGATFATQFHVDAGAVVPEAVWPTTDRVSSIVEAKIDHRLDVVGWLERLAEPHQCCDGCPTCRCSEANVRVRVDGPWAEIEWIDEGDTHKHLVARPGVTPGNTEIWPEADTSQPRPAPTPFPHESA